MITNGRSTIPLILPRRTVRFRIIIGFLLAAGVCAALSGCAPSSGLQLTGTVDSALVTVETPALFTPQLVIDPNTGYASVSTSTVTAASRGTGATSLSAITGLGTFLRVASVEASEGERVEAGQVLVAFDSALLEENVAFAEKTATLAQAQIAVVDAKIDDTYSAESDLKKTRRDLVDTIAELKATRANLAAQLAQAKGLLESLPTTGTGSVGTTSTPPPSSSGGAASTPNPMQLKAATEQLTAGIGKIDAGLAKAQAGLGKIDSAGSKLSDARTLLTGLRDIASAAADASRIGVLLAEYQLSSAVVRAPVDGIIVRIADAGDLLAPGSTAALIQEDATQTVTTWLTAEELGEVGLGDPVKLRGDWMAGWDASGIVSLISDSAEYPPTSFATDRIHMARAFKVRIALTSVSAGSSLPRGAPVDVLIETGSAKDSQ
ncbi:MAG: HlyD family secretion protein [Coriobacteriia bacterium]